MLVSNPKTLHAIILLLYTDTTSERALEISVKFRKSIREIWHVFKKLPLNFLRELSRTLLPSNTGIRLMQPFSGCQLNKFPVVEIFR